MNTVVRIGTAAAAVAALAMTAAGCRKGSDPVPAPVALVDAAAASSATSAPGAWPDPLAAPPTAATATAAGPVQRSVARAVVATAKTAAVACAAPSSAGLWLALADDRGLTVRELSAAATPTDAGVVVATAQRPTALHCGSGAQAFWLSADRGRTVAVVARGVVRPVPARASVHGLVAQSDGAAVLAASSADTDKVELVRLTPQLEPVWQREVPVPGEVTAVTATLRDDVVLVGRKPTATGPVWWLLRAGQRDGAVAWTRTLDAAHAPAQAAVVAAVPSPEGVLLVLESHAPARAGAAAGWSIVQVDANGGVAARSTVAQRAPQVVAAGHTSAAIWAQARGQGLVVERAMGPGAVAEATAPWPSPETPLALAVDDSEQWWAISAAAHPAHDVWTVLATRFGKHEDAEPAARDAACTAKWTLRAPVRQVADGLTDGTPCGPDATCLAGQCRPAGR